MSFSQLNIAIAGGMLAPYAEIDHLPAEFIEAGLEGIKFWENIPASDSNAAAAC